jgi:tetratricopeptide (TPR) repeat protein
LLLLLAAAGYLVYYFTGNARGSIVPGPGSARRMRAMDAVLNAYRTGDCTTALQRCDDLRDGPPNTAPYYFFRGDMLLELGKLTEGEASIRQALLLERNPHILALFYDRLGEALIEQGRYAEAITCFQDSIQTLPNQGGSHRGIAEALLRHDADIPEALSQAHRATAIDRTEAGLDAKTRNLNLSEDLGVLAWATAASSGNAGEVGRLLAEAFPLCGDWCLPNLAKLHYCAGRAYEALHIAEKRSYHFSQASTLDPQGCFGRLARAKLSTER